ncbi:hypothetical protein JKY72_02450 [Candidatus Gracilibacteria bacterium]|nr:hypothetical protein [Candidatus Gracilibacteria bacterium]
MSSRLDLDLSSAPCDYKDARVLEIEYTSDKARAAEAFRRLQVRISRLSEYTRDKVSVSMKGDLIIVVSSEIKLGVFHDEHVTYATLSYSGGFEKPEVRGRTF